MTLNLDLIHEAAAFLKGCSLRRTPLEHSPTLSDLMGVPVYLKLENLQITGSFKVRGALFRLHRLTPAEKARGVISCSAGNHGKAVAYAAGKSGVSVDIYVPKVVDESKYRGMIQLGARVIKSDFESYDRTEALARAEARRRGRTFISPYDDEAIMAANGGSLMAEIIEDLPDLKTVLTPVGGGGLAAGLCYFLSEKQSEVETIGCQLAASPALHLSLERGRAVTTLPYVETAAGGLEGGIGSLTFPIIRRRIGRVVLLSEDAVVRGVRWMLDRHQYLIEPSAAVVIAALTEQRLQVRPGPMVLILTGRNLSLAGLTDLLS